MSTTIILFILMILLNLYFASKKQGRMKIIFYAAAALWALVAIFDISRNV